MPSEFSHLLLFVSYFAASQSKVVVPNLVVRVPLVVREYILFVIRPKGVLSSGGVDFEFFGAVDVV